MLRRATLLLLLLPGIGLAQTSTGTVTATVTTQGTPGLANRTECASDTSVATWNIVTQGITTATGDKWRLSTAASGQCSTTVPATTFLKDILVTGTTQSVTGIFVKQMATEASVATCDQANDIQISLCVYYLPQGQVPTTTVVFTGVFSFQLAIPPTPVITKVTPGDAQLTVAVTPGTPTATETAATGVTYKVSCGTSTATGNAGNIVCSGLTNGTSYLVTATATSAAGNPGLSAASVGPNDSTTPLPFLSFWDKYKSDGGVETGGCSTGGAGALAPVLALLGLLVARRRRS